MAAVGQLTVQDLMFAVKDSFHSVAMDIDSIISAIEQSKMLRKKEIKYLKNADEESKRSFVYNKLYGGGKSITPDGVVKLFEDTGIQQNVHFAKTLQSNLSSLQKSAKSGQFTKCMLYLENRSVNKWLPVNCCNYRVFCCSSLFICLWSWRSKMPLLGNILLNFTLCHS